MTLEQLGETMSADEFGLWLADDALRRAPPAAAPAPRALSPEEFFEAVDHGRQ